MKKKQRPIFFSEGGKLYRVLPDKLFDVVNNTFLTIFFCGLIAVWVSISGVFSHGFMSNGAISDTAWVFMAGCTLWVLGLFGQYWIVMKMDCMIYFVQNPKKVVPSHVVQTKEDAFRINIR